MVRIVGNKYIIFLMSLFSMYAWAEISLRITDENGSPLESVGVGRPFLLQVEMKTMYDVQRDLVITHLDKFEHYRTGTQMVNINGSRSTTYTYRCRIDIMGTYVLGPAFIPGTPEKSKTLSIVVGEKPEYKESQKKEDEKILFRIFIDPEKLVVGQKALMRARFYAADGKTQLQAITLPAIPAFRIVSKQGPYYGSEEINRVKYDYIEWRYEIFAKDPGNIFVPAFCADYEMPNNRGYSFFWRMQPILKRAYSNSLRIAVDPLPPHPSGKSVVPDFVGSKAAAHASLQPAQAKLGDGILYTITFEGEGDLETVQAPNLKGMPEGLKYYDSKVTPIDSNSPDELSKKQFEYVVQGMKEGTYRLPAQQFEVFDVETRKYKTVSTMPLQLTIAGGTVAQKIHTNATETVVLEDSKIRPIAEHGPWYPTPPRAPINWVLFFILICAPCMYIGAGFARTQLKRFENPQRRTRIAFASARKNVEHADKNKQYGQYYHIFIQLFSEIFATESQHISLEYTIQKLQNIGASPAMIAEWESFFTELAACAFGNESADAKLGMQATMWLEKLSGVFR